MKFSPAIALLPALVFFGWSRPADGAAPDRPPNIVFIFIDDMGYADPSCFGNPLMKTPRIDQLADEGLKLTNFYVNSPICSPSRVAVTTGQYPMRWGIHSYLNSRKINAEREMKDFLDPSAPTIAKLLKTKGYATAHFGKWHMGGGRDVDDAPLPSAYGFDESLVSFEGLGDRVIPPGTEPGKGLTGQSLALGRGEIIETDRWKNTERYVDRTINFMRQHRDQPFFIRLFPNDVHDPHVSAPGTLEKWADVTEDDSWQKFFAVLEEMDRQIGRVIDEIEALDLTEETLIVFTSDNGPTDWPNYYQAEDREHPPGFTGPFYGRKWSLYEGGIRMPFIARWPGTVPAGQTDDESLMCGIDLAPTFAKFASAEIPDDNRLDGHDRSAALLGQPSTRPEPIFWQYGAPHARLMPGNPDFISPTLAVRDGDWKLLANADGSDAQLFNLVKDPGETTNLLETETELANRLWNAIQTWASEIGMTIDADGELMAPLPPPLLHLGGGLSVEMVNRGAAVSEDGETWTFDGRSWLEVQRGKAPKIASSRITLAADIEAKGDPNGVIVAQGGDRNGFSLYIKDRRPTFAVCRNWKRTVITSPTPLQIDEGIILIAALTETGNMVLQENGETVAEGNCGGLIPNEPGDSLQFGADLIKPAGDYQVPHYFSGTVSNVMVMIGKKGK